MLFKRQNLKPSGKLRSFVWQIVTKFRKNTVPSSAESISPSGFLGLLDPADKGTTLLRNVGDFTRHGVTSRLTFLFSTAVRS
jgi:hypothetical protein